MWKRKKFLNQEDGEEKEEGEGGEAGAAAGGGGAGGGGRRREDRRRGRQNASKILLCPCSAFPLQHRRTPWLRGEGINGTRASF